MNTARVEIESGEKVVHSKEEVLNPLQGLWTPGPHAHASVGLTVGTQVDFGRVKVSAHVTYECDQKADVVDKAGMLAFTKAVEFMNSGLELLAGEEKQK